jgi:hypothetical protein
VSDAENLAEIHRGSLAMPVVWHLHGFIDRPKQIILTPDGYEELYPEEGQVQEAYEAARWTLRHLLTARTFLFIGFGMEEAIRQQIRWVREIFGGAGGKHFVLVRDREAAAMEGELHGLSVQPIPIADFGRPLLDLLGELAGHAESGGLRAPAPLPPLEADPRPYLEYLRKDTGFIEIRGLRLNVAEAPRFPIQSGDADGAGGAALEREADAGAAADLYDSILTWLARSRKRRPGRLSPEDCIKALQELAGAMQGHAEGRQVQVSYQQRDKNVDALVSAALDDLYDSLAGVKPDLTRQARCFGLLGTMLRDLQPRGYRPADPRYAEVKDAVLGIFEADKAAAIPLPTRLAAAEALGQAGDPRLRLPRDPDYWVRVEGFEIGRYPVTVEEYKLFVDDGGPKPARWDDQLLRPNCPVGRVTWFDAKACCDWAGARLPSEAEWERAARGPEGRQYPWGNEEPDPDRANCSETSIRRASPVGLFPRGSTPDGIADLAGNVWEWFEYWYDASKHAPVARRSAAGAGATHSGAGFSGV